MNMSVRRADIGIKSARLQSVARSGAQNTTAVILRLFLMEHLQAKTHEH